MRPSCIEHDTYSTQHTAFRCARASDCEGGPCTSFFIFYTRSLLFFIVLPKYAPFRAIRKSAVRDSCASAIVIPKHKIDISDVMGLPYSWMIVKQAARLAGFWSLFGVPWTWYSMEVSAMSCNCILSFQNFSRFLLGCVSLSIKSS